MQQSTPSGACVEFVYRVYEDGRRERRATVLVPTAQGDLRPGPSRPTGALGEFVAAAVREWRRVGIDPRHQTRTAERHRR
jgi:hypothetical protein